MKRKLNRIIVSFISLFICVTGTLAVFNSHTELNNKFKAINKDIQMIVNYSDNVHDNMNKISLFITELGDIINKINEKLIMKIKK